jgi:hypothetical protein
MRTHTANEMQFSATLLQPDNATVIATGVGCGVEDLAGNTRAQAQLQAPETTHLILMRYLDGLALSNAGYVSVEGVLYIVDYLRDPRRPRPRVWIEVYCHAERTVS